MMTARTAFFAAAASIAVFGALFLTLRPDADALARILVDQCGIRSARGAVSEPCLKVDQDQGYAVLRDRKGSHHYLLLPTLSIAGVEDASLLEPTTPNYFWWAWQNRHHVSAQEPNLSDADISLAVNSRYGRSQNHLHIHIACISPDVRATLDRLEFNSHRWQRISDGLLPHDYWIRKTDPREFREKGPFQILADEFPVDAEAMGRFGIAVAKARDGDFLLLATRVSLIDLNLASAGELQDQDCRSRQSEAGSPG